MRYCSRCGRPKHKGLCDLVKLTDGKLVHASRLERDLSDKVGDDKDVKVENRHVKRGLLKKR